MTKQQTVSIEAVRAHGRRVGFEPHGEIVWRWRSDGSVVIHFPSLPPSKNQYSRTHWRTQHHAYFEPWYTWTRQPWRDFWEGTLTLVRPSIKGSVRIGVELVWPDRRRRDIQNYIGFPPLYDAMKNLGVIDDDSCAMDRPIARVGDEPGVWMTITPIKKEVSE